MSLKSLSTVLTHFLILSLVQNKKKAKYFTLVKKGQNVDVKHFELLAVAFSTVICTIYDITSIRSCAKRLLHIICFNTDKAYNLGFE